MMDAFKMLQIRYIVIQIKKSPDTFLLSGKINVIASFRNYVL